MSCRNSSCRRNDELVRELRRSFGETVTVYTTSGGDSGSGFTGVLIGVTCDFARLLSDMGSAPGCALGSCCDNRNDRCNCNFEDNEDDDRNTNNKSRNRIDCSGRNTGAIVDIPVERIAAFVHNAI